MKATITKLFGTLKKAKAYQNKLYEQYNQVHLTHSPLFSESGTYTWEVDKPIRNSNQDHPCPA